MLLLSDNMIYIDTREKTDTIMDIISSMPDLLKKVDHFTIKKLDLGDYLIEKTNGDTVLIERKTITDFMTSVYNKSGNGTLSSKLMRMRTVADEAILLIEGNYTRSSDGFVHAHAGKYGLPYGVFQTFQLHRQRPGCRLLHTNDLTETLYLMLVLEKDISIRPDLKIDSWDQFIMLLPNIGQARLDKIKNKYSNPVEAMQHIDEWLKGLPLDRW